MRKIEIPPVIQEHIKKEYLSGTPGTIIASKLGYSVDTLYRTLRRMGISPGVIGSERGLGAGGKWKLNVVQEMELVTAYNRGSSLRNLAAMHGVTEKTVRRVLAKNSVEMRSRHVRPMAQELIDAVAKDWKAGERVSDLLAKYNIGATKLTRLLLIAGISRRKDIPTGSDHWNYKGGRRVNPHGYVQIIMPKDHPFYLQMADAGGHVMQHRLVMADSMGRPLRRKETVYHVDGNRQNNALSNLELHQNLHGSGSKWVCADCGSHNIVATDIGVEQ